MNNKRPLFSLRSSTPLALTLAMGALLSLPCTTYAVVLGQLVTTSALNQPYKGEIDLPDITPEDYKNLKVTLAGKDEFDASGLDYNAALTSTEFILKRRSNGRAYVEVKGTQAITDPFLSIALSANWASGRLIKNYTVLLDPQNTATVSEPIAVLPARNTLKNIKPIKPVKPIKDDSNLAGTQQTPTPPPVPVSETKNTRVTVNRGDTASAIVGAKKASNVSLEQMLVALLKNNPDAFINNNVNRLKTGAILNMPSAEEALATPAPQANDMVVAQSKDFGAFRQKLARHAFKVKAKTPKNQEREDGGQVKTEVQDQNTNSIKPDKLTLSKGSNSSKATETEVLNSIIQNKKTKASEERMAELSKNINDINKLGNLTSVTVPSAAPLTVIPAIPTLKVSPKIESVTASSGAAVSVPTTALVSAGQSPVLPVPSVLQTEKNTLSDSSKNPTTTDDGMGINGNTNNPVSANVPSSAAMTTNTSSEMGEESTPTNMPVKEKNTKELLKNNIVPIGGALAALALGGLGWWWNKKRKANKHNDDEEYLFDDHLDDDSSFDPTGNDHGDDESVTLVQTATNGSSVQPNPNANVNNAIKTKLNAETGIQTQSIDIVPAVIGSANVNANSFTPKTANSFVSMSSIKPQNASAVASIAAQNSLVSSPDATVSIAGIANKRMDSFPQMTPSAFATRTVAHINPEQSKSPASVDLDLDFDFVASAFPSALSSSLQSAPVVPKKPPQITPQGANASAALFAPDFDIPMQTLPIHTPNASAVTTMAPTPMGLDNKVSGGTVAFDVEELGLSFASPSVATASVPTPLSVPAVVPVSAAVSQTHLETKLALAQEFRAIGDAMGAKMLANEVAAQATGTLQTQATNFLAEMG